FKDLHVFSRRLPFCCLLPCPCELRLDCGGVYPEIAVFVRSFIMAVGEGLADVRGFLKVLESVVLHSHQHPPHLIQIGVLTACAQIYRITLPFPLLPSTLFANPPATLSSPTLY